MRLYYQCSLSSDPRVCLLPSLWSSEALYLNFYKHFFVLLPLTTHLGQIPILKVLPTHIVCFLSHQFKLLQLSLLSDLACLLFFEALAQDWQTNGGQKLIAEVWVLNMDYVWLVYKYAISCKSKLWILINYFLKLHGVYKLFNQWLFLLQIYSWCLKSPLTSTCAVMEKLPWRDQMMLKNYQPQM